MTVSSTTSRMSYTAGGGTIFAFTFKIFEKSDLYVKVNNILKSIDTDYTVPGTPPMTGGNVVFLAAPTAGASVVIDRILLLTQSTDYIEGDKFPAETHEAVADRGIMIAQQLNQAIADVVAGAGTDAAMVQGHYVNETAVGNDKILVYKIAGDEFVYEAKGTPDVHAVSHEVGGGDEISVDGLSGTLVDPQLPDAHKTSHQNGGSDEISVLGLSGLLADSQTPLAHKTSHEDGGSDEISVAGLAGVLTDKQDADKIQGHTVDETAIADDKILVYHVAGDKFAYESKPIPTVHATTHEEGGADELDLTDLMGLLGEKQDADHIQGHIVDETDIANNRILVYKTVGDKFIYEVKGTPVGHATTHQDGGGDEIDLAGLSGEPATLATHKALNASVHGVGASGFEDKVNKDAASGYSSLDAGSKIPTANLGGAGADNTKYLRGDQTWVAPAGGGDMLKSTYDPNADGVIAVAQLDTDVFVKSVLTEQGDVIYASGVATPAALHHGTAGQVLQSGGDGANPSWLTLPVKASGAEVDTGTDDAKFATAKAIADSKLSYTDGTETLTNKRITARITTITSHATPTINTDNCDAVTITAQAEAITSMTTNLSGTPTNFQKLIIRIKDNATAQTIAWGAKFVAKGVALPTTTVISKLLTVGFIYDTVLTTWGCVASVQEA